jgi:hypothetical protein
MLAVDYVVDAKVSRNGGYERSVEVRGELFAE